ncbi:MAG: hypothetical protein KAW93_10375 [Methanogenium sp.]|nr:hypothetical protein [Methanogenium sp.]
MFRVKTGGSGRPPPGAGKIPRYYADEEPDSDIAQCPEVGTVSQGGTVEEAVANLREATEFVPWRSPTLLA